MSLPFLKTTPRAAGEWESWHFQHYIDHKIILGVVAKKAGILLHMPVIWPVPNNDFTARLAEFHQFLHQQMNAVSGTSSTDMTHVSLKTPDQAQKFVDQNYREHLIFHQFVGIPV